MMSDSTNSNLIDKTKWPKYLSGEEALQDSK